MLRSFFFHDHAKHGEDDARAGEPALASSQTGSTITAGADNTSAKAPVSTPNSTPTPPAEADAAVPADDAEALAFARASSAVSDQLFNTARANAASDSSKTPDVKADAAPNQQPAGPDLQADSEQLLSQIAQQSAHTKITALKQPSSAQKKPDNEVHTIIIHTEPARIDRLPPEHSQQDEQGLTGHAAPAAYAAQTQTYSANTNTVIMRSPVPPVMETSAHPANVPVQTQSSVRKQHQSSRWWDTFSSNTNVWRAGDNAQNSAAGLGSDADAGTGSSAEHEAAAGTSTGSPAPEGQGSDSDSAAVTAAAAGSVSASASDSESIFEVVSAKPLRPFSASVTSTQAVSTSAEPVITSVEPENSDRPEDTKDEASAQSGSTPAQSADLEALNDHGELFTRPESSSGSESISENSENAEYHENDESSDAAESSARADGSQSSDEVDDSAEAALPAEPSDLSSEQPSKDTAEPASELPSGQHSVDAAAAAAGEIKTDAEPAVKNQTEADAEVATVTDDQALVPAQSREQGHDPEPEQKPEQKPEQSEDAHAQQSKPVQQVYLQRGEESHSRPVSLMAVPYGKAFSYVSAMPDLSAAVYSNVQMKFHFVSAFKSAASAAAKLISHPAGTEDPAQAAAPPAQESASTIEEQPLPLAADAAASAAQGSDNASAPKAAAAPSPALKLKLSVGRFKDAFEMSQLEYKSAAFEPRTNPLPGPSKLTAIWEERLKHRTHMVILARDETTGELIGFAAIEKPFICGYIRAVYIAPQYFRCGVGRALVEACANHLRLFGARKVALEVEKHNSGAKAFYEALNFRPSAVQSTPHLMRLEKEL